MHFGKVNPLSLLACSATNTVSSLSFVVIDVSTKLVVFSDMDGVRCKGITEDTKVEGRKVEMMKNICESVSFLNVQENQKFPSCMQKITS